MMSNNLDNGSPLGKQAEIVISQKGQPKININGFLFKKLRTVMTYFIKFAKKRILRNPDALQEQLQPL